VNPALPTCLPAGRLSCASKNFPSKRFQI
jgi:hypothetical protein